MSVMWSVLSAAFVLALWGMDALLGDSGETFTFGQWAVYVVWLLWSLFGVALVWTFINEKESRAAGLSTLIFGGVSVIGGVALALLWIF